MSVASATEEYKQALKKGQKEYKELTAAGKDPYPAVLDELLGSRAELSARELPITEIPTERIVGVKSEGRVSAFSAGFLPLLDADTEFAAKWISLCDAHLGDTGIRDPIVCFEYLGNFYVQEGNKRVSVLKYFESPRIPARVTRLLPPVSDEPAIKAYYEFLDFYDCTGLYDVRFVKPGSYAKLIAFLGKEKDEEWTDAEKRRFSTYFHYFREAFRSLGGESRGLRPEEALLLWLEVYPYAKLGEFSTQELKRSLAGLWGDVTAGEPVSIDAVPEPQKKNIISSIIKPSKGHLNVAFVHQRDTAMSLWTLAHDNGRKYLESVMGDKLTALSYFNADDPDDAETLIERAVADGAEAVFTTTPSLLRPTLKAAVKYPKVRFFNCSADVPFSSVRGYYVRAFEGKFITGAIAGAVSKTDKIGYIASYPILGVPASINAFALGAQMTNPDARIEVRWSCLAGNHTEEFLREGITVISNRDVPTLENKYLEYGEFGTFAAGEDGALTPLGAPCWLWGSFYEKAVKAILSGSIDKNAPDSVNYWLGLSGGVLDVSLGDSLPEGVRFLAERLREGLISGTLDPFRRRIVSQSGEVKNDGSRGFTAEELLHMDWLCENVEGHIPAYDEVLPMSRATVRELGLDRDAIAPEKEAAR